MSGLTNANLKPRSIKLLEVFVFFHLVVRNIKSLKFDYDKIVIFISDR